MDWGTLSLPWQRCFELAWESHQEGSNPIGAVVADSSGAIMSEGKSAVRGLVTGMVTANCEIAHAEINALLGLDNRQHPKLLAKDYVLYASLEPCPVCFSAFYMSDLQTLRFAAFDGFAGSINLLGTTPYLSRKPRRCLGPEPALETFSIFLNVWHDVSQGLPLDDPVHEAMRSDYPRAVALARETAVAGDPILENAGSVREAYDRFLVLEASSHG
ncbi:MAG: nucleoside deaminase [Pseudomonadota bacterium]